jgi:hypothetical protein
MVQDLSNKAKGMMDVPADTTWGNVVVKVAVGFPVRVQQQITNS